MRKKQLVALFLCSLVPWVAGNGLVPLLPVYAAKLGAGTGTAGLYLALSYLAIALGAISAGWVSDALRRRKLFILLAGLVSIPLAWWMGQIHGVAGLTILTAVLWFFGGLGLALVSILTGMSAGEHERGKIFGILTLTSGLGALIGGLGIGWMVNRWGYQGMFHLLAVFMLVWPASALFLEEKETLQKKEQTALPQPSASLGRNYAFLFTANIFTAMTSFSVVLLRSVLMKGLGFDALAISSTGAVGGLAALPVPVVLGWLSDRTSRKNFLFIGYLATLASIILLAFSRSLWHFWIVFALAGIANQNNPTIGNALVTDWLPPQLLGKGLARMAATGWIGAVIGFAISGWALQHLGLMPTIAIGAGLGIVAILLLLPIQGKEH